MGVDLADEEHIATLRCIDVAVVLLVEDECITTHVLHKDQRFGLPKLALIVTFFGARSTRGPRSA